jgi:hypothetical protein
MAKIKTKRERVKFASDNVAGACPEVLMQLLKQMMVIVHHMETTKFQLSYKINSQKFLKKK